jgi:AraC-like DNA-binding protein
MISECQSVTTNQKGKELKIHGSSLFPVGCYYEDVAEVPVVWHWHEELEAVIVTEGAVVVGVGSERVEVDAGNGFFVNSGVLHAAWPGNAPVGRIHTLVFHPRLVGGGLDSIFWQKYIIPLVSDTSLSFSMLERASDRGNTATKCIEQAWNACRTEGYGYELRVREYLSELVSLLVSHSPASNAPLSDKTLRDARRIKMMLQFIQDNCGEEISVAEIAESAIISESECLRCFRNTIGTTPIQYLKQFRIRKAAELLGSTDMKIVDIGVECGFSEMSYFAKTFRELQGCAPSEYRRRKRQDSTCTD